MKYFNKTEKIVIGVMVVLIGVILAVGNSSKDASLSGSSASQKCEVSSVARAVVGNQSSSVILSESSNRAWARIERLDNSTGIATNTVYISFDEGAAATLTTGLTLATTTQSIDFGLNTLFPYTGAVTGITDKGSTTVQVTECKFTQ